MTEEIKENIVPPVESTDQPIDNVPESNVSEEQKINWKRFREEKENLRKQKIEAEKLAAQKAKEGLKFPLGNAHWENKAEDTMVADLRYASEMNTSAEYKKSVDGLAKYARSHKAEH